MPMPLARYAGAGAFDSRRQRTVIFSGFTGASSVTPDTWEYYAPMCDLAGLGHPGGGIPLTCVTAPRIGTTFTTRFSSPGGSGVGVLLIGTGPCLNTPISVGTPALCSPGFLFTNPSVLIVVPGEPAVLSLPIPQSPPLVGVALCLQAAALQPAVCFRVTDALSVVLQP
jgi:hypothetical protein